MAKEKKKLTEAEIKAIKEKNIAKQKAAKEGKIITK